MILHRLIGVAAGLVTATSLAVLGLALVAEDDRARLPSGTTVEGIPVGDLTPSDAAALLRDQVEGPLHRLVTIRSGGFTATATPWELGLRVDVDAAVDRALRGGSGQTVASQLWRRWGGGSSGPAVEARAAWTRGGGLDDLLQAAAAALAREPSPAGWEEAGGWLTYRPERPGRALDVERSRRALQESIGLGATVVNLVTTTTAPGGDTSVGDTSVGGDGGPPNHQAILVRTGENRLYLYERGLITRSWPVATGASGFETPTGRWEVVAKYVDPDWVNPGSDWAQGLPARIPPGPNNPLGTRALALDAPGILIHATPDVGSIGYSASHGCVRMRPADELELFDAVEVGTPVLIVDAGDPVSRGGNITPADPGPAAAVIY